eukprot:CAMPEP_0202353152 /NCGR_PEP_ID=MMETSP1126-20121109/9038_1 /ASSEMBLY_ACC=CAM_ASM_000457 /TAXON_ID=3047 /ORGANISM="Dunaliella tertiolecta, Strain CCMP1320" /LENGTH=79 /DNA_ID=CAMNT_0048945465 /DNA_START=287 /DNA_END=526 /DNA_ORIENTATION=-
MIRPSASKSKRDIPEKDTFFPLGGASLMGPRLVPSAAQCTNTLSYMGACASSACAPAAIDGSGGTLLEGCDGVCTPAVG